MIDTTEYKKHLEADLSRITEELKTLGVNNPQTDDWIETVPEHGPAEADSNSEADLAEDLEERRATLNDFEIEYRHIKLALQKIEEGTYGICEISGEPIEESRLQFKPSARTCMKHMDEENQLPL